MATQAAPKRERARTAKSEAPPMGHNQGPVMREQAREPAREKVITGYFDREGNPISRKNPAYRNEFDFHPGEVPEGWEYQWIRHTVHGDPSESELWDMQENGWRPVPHQRHANRFGPGELVKGDIEKGKTSCILRKGQLLVERPKGMCDEARAQQKREADSAVGEQFRRFAVPLPDNVAQMGLRGAGSIARRSNAPSAAWAPQGADTSHDQGAIDRSIMPKHELAID